MIQATFYGHIGKRAQKIVPQICKLQTDAFCTVIVNGEGCNDLAIHLTREQAQAIYDGLGRELAADPVGEPVSFSDPAPAEIPGRFDDDMPF